MLRWPAPACPRSRWAAVAVALVTCDECHATGAQVPAAIVVVHVHVQQAMKRAALCVPRCDKKKYKAKKAASTLKLLHLTADADLHIHVAALARDTDAHDVTDANVTF